MSIYAASHKPSSSRKRRSSLCLFSMTCGRVSHHSRRRNVGEMSSPVVLSRRDCGYSDGHDCDNCRRGQ
jgi:hypothetical protein